MYPLYTYNVFSGYTYSLCQIKSYHTISYSKFDMKNDLTLYISITHYLIYTITITEIQEADIIK